VRDPETLPFGRPERGRISGHAEARVSFQTDSSGVLFRAALRPAGGAAAMNFRRRPPLIPPRPHNGGNPMNGIIYLVGLVVVILAVLSFFGMH
jgi:hypothetical protein